MENALTGIIIIGVMILAILGLSQGTLMAQAGIADATRLMQTRLADQARTSVQALSASTSVLGDMVYITIKNTGSAKLADFAHWDVILTYPGSLPETQVEWHAIQSKQIYLTAASGQPEIIEPGILNPGEEMVIYVDVLFDVGLGTTNVATVSTPNGITASTIFTR
jgi:archaeal flagellar protein FlaF